MTAVVWVGCREQRAFGASLIQRNCRKRRGEKSLEWVTLMSHLSLWVLLSFPTLKLMQTAASLACKAGTVCILMAVLWWGGWGQLVMQEIH